MNQFFYMQKKLGDAIEKFVSSKTSRESYEAISSFVEMIELLPEFINF